MSRDNSYLTEIEFTPRRARKFRHTFRAQYILSKSFEDDIEISRGLAKISSERKSAVKLSDIFTNYSSAIYKQIVRAICLYYVHSNSADALAGITVTRVLHGIERGRVSLGKKDLGKIVDGSADFSLLAGLKASSVGAILREGVKGNAVLFALTHLIRATDSQGSHDRFEKLWRAFNALYKAQTKLTKDHDCHRSLRAYMQANPADFPNSIARVHNLSATEIRNKIRWNKMIQNYFPTQAHAGAFRDFVLRNQDHRVMEMFHDTVGIRRDHLLASGDLQVVLNHLQTHRAAKVSRDQDVLSLLAFKYMYFVRNRLAHAERTDAGFTLVEQNRENQELSWLNQILASLVVDLINFNSKY